MADFFLSNLKSTLDNCITELDEIHSMFCRNPESDFTRNRKLSFREYIQFMLQMQSKSISNAVNICRAYLKHGGDETETMLLIQKLTCRRQDHPFMGTLKQLHVQFIFQLPDLIAEGRL